jgi:hypothetical protein
MMRMVDILGEIARKNLIKKKLLEKNPANDMLK